MKMAVSELFSIIRRVRELDSTAAKEAGHESVYDAPTLIMSAIQKISWGNQRLDAIKDARQAFGCDLCTAKTFCDNINNYIRRG